MNQPEIPAYVYTRVYEIVREVPPGKVVTYGQLAAIVGGCTARMVGYAMAACPSGSDIPWQRVINAQGKISLRVDSHGNSLQRQLLEAEGVEFDANGKTNLRRFQWSGPQLDWLLDKGYDPEPLFREL